MDEGLYGGDGASEGDKTSGWLFGGAKLLFIGGDLFGLEKVGC
jgi:hypothetical protein